MARDAKGRFVKGPDADRHVFTKEDCIAGYDKLVERLGGSCGILEAKRRAFFVMCTFEAKRYNNPALAPVEPTRFKTAKDHKEEYKAKYGKDHSIGPVTVETLDTVAEHCTEAVYDWLAGEPETMKNEIPASQADPFSTRFLEEARK